ncbi:MAG: ATP-binding cassette domain-containing protein [Alphaproteobacteria bacterium]|nr:ATP-binding cassette domain-containing protein [Alphaproteobacteria bacterium]
MPIFRNGHLQGGIKPHTCTAIVGANGSGKTTFLKLISGLIQPQSGRCGLTPGIKASYLTQLQHYDRIYPLRVIDVVNMGHAVPPFLLWGYTDVQMHKSLSALEMVKLAHKKDHHISQLSGGEFQRMLFARVLVEDSDLILLDEPFTSMDEQTINSVLDLMKTLTTEYGKTILCVCHDLGLIPQHFSHVLHVKNQQVQSLETQHWINTLMQNGGRSAL